MSNLVIELLLRLVKPLIAVVAQMERAGIKVDREHLQRLSSRFAQEIARLEEEIFVEAAPISETRGYVKKILTSTVMYGVLHYGKNVGEMVRLIYPGFRP